MKKPANRILSMLLALIMVLSMLPASVLADGETESALKGWNIILGDDIGVKFTLNSADYTVITTVNGAEVTPTISGETVTVNVAAAQMTDTIGLTVKNGEETVHTGEYSVRQYAETILTGEYNDEVKQMVLNMLNYGAAAQTYFAYNTEPLANAGYELETVAAVPTEVPDIQVEDDLSGIALYGMSLLFQNKTAVRFYFHGSGDMNSYTFKVGDTVYEPVAKGDQYYVQVSGINPQDLDKSIDLVVSRGEDTLTVSYSPMTYIVRKYNADSTAALKNLMQAMYGYYQEAVAYRAYQQIVKIDTLVEHPDSNNNWSSGGIYMATQEPNDVSFEPSWSLEFAPTSSSVIKRIRNGETIDVAIAGRGTIAMYAADKFYLNINSWTMGDNAPAEDGDVYIIEGDFYNSANDATIRFGKNYIYLNGTNAEFSKEMPTLPTTVAGGVMMEVENYGWTGGTGDLIFKMDNAAPTGGYAPTSADNIKLIRDGETYDVGYVGVDVIGKHNETWYTLAFWTIVNYKPMLANDILVIEGDFYQTGTKTTLNISKTYVLLNADGSASFSTEMPDLGTYVEAGMMSAHSTNGWASSADAAGNLQFALADNEAPAGYYRPTAASNVKLIRNGVTYDVGHNLRDTISKVSNEQYILEFWTIADHKPMVANDILIVEGEFRQESSNTTLNITKTYILLNADGTATFSATEPAPATEVDCGVMSEHADGNASELYFTLAANSIPVDEELVYPYAGTVQLVNSSSTSNVNANIYKLADDQYYLELEGVELSNSSYLIVEGAFSNADNGYTMNITKTYVSVDGDSLVYSETEPVLETEYALTGLTNHPNGWNADGIYISHNAHGAHYNSDWSVEYKPVSADVIKLVRDGVTTSIGQPVSGTLVVYDSAKMLFKTAAWTIQGGVLPFVDGDKIIIEGKFVHAASGNILVAEKTVIYVNGTDLIFNPIEAGNLGDHSNGMNSNGEGIYATMAENAAPYSGWSIEYTPVTADAYYVIRDGEQINIGISGRGTLVKYSDTNYYLKINAWCTNNFAYTTDDIIVIDGFWKQNTGGSAMMKIEKTYLYYNGSAWVFSATEPAPEIPGSTMKACSENKWSSTSASNPGNLLFALDDNSAPSGYYRPTDAANVKLIRNGVTYDVGHNLRDTIYKQDNGKYIFEFWTIADHKPMVANDILVVEGDFYQASSDTTLKISKTYVLLNADGTATFSATEPVPTIQGGMMSKVDGFGWTSNSDGSGSLIFQMNNTAPTGDYQPTSASNIKLIRDGQTYDVAYVGQNVINKANDTWYAVAFWTIVDYKPMLANDILVVEGDFKHASSDTYLNISKTYILFNEDGTATFSNTEPVIGPESSHGLMNVTNWQKPASNPDGSANDGGLYFTLAENDVAYTTDWATQYTPVAAENIKLVRNGVESNVANTAAGMIIKYSATEYYLQFWPITLKPMQAGDMMIVEGKFKNASNGSVLNITKTYIVFNENGTVSVFENSPMIVDAGVINAHTQGWFNNGFFFTMEANNAPAGSLDDNNGGDWTVEYTPSSTAVIKWIRDSVTTEIAMVDRGTITKLSDTVYYFRIDDWATPSISNRNNLRDGDMLVVEGEFYGKSDSAAKGYTLNISKSYIIFDSVEAGTITFSTGTNTEFGDVVLPNSSKTLKIGVWNGSYHVFTNERLAELKAAGITKIMGIDPQWTGEEYGGITGMLDRAAAYGIDVIVDLRSWDGETVPEYVNHEALMGFLMYDEPCATDFDELAELKAKFDSVMPDDVLFFVNLYGSSAASSALFGGLGLGKTYEDDYVQQFLDKLGVEVLSWDSYPLVEEDGMRTGYFQNFEIMASKDVPLWFTMLSSGHDTTSTHYEIPTAEDLRWQMAVAMTYGVQNIDHYIYTSHEDDYSCMYDLDTGTVTDLYYDIKDVNNEYLAWDNIYMAYNWVGVGKYSANNNDAMLDKLSKCVDLANHGVSSVSASENLLIGVFENNGNKAYMVTNAGSTSDVNVGDGKQYTAQDTTVTLTLDAGNYKCAAIIDNGEISYVAVNNNTVTLTVEAFEGVFVIPVLN